MEAAVQDNVKDVVCPDSSERIEQRLREAVEQVICFVKNDCDTLRLSGFEGALWPRALLLYRLCVALFLAVRHERLDVRPHVQRGRSRLKKEFAERTIKTWGGPVRYGRAYVLNVVTQRGWFPLDAALGITQDGFSLRVIGMVTRLATRRGFPPGTDKRVQVVIDGEHTLRANLQELFPDAILTLDLRHAQERLWKAGRVFHKEGSDELTRWVEPLNTLLLDGRIKTLLKRLQHARDGIARQGPNTKTRRETLQSQINYFRERVDMMKYDEYRRQDLVLATGVIEGACRYVVGERLDCSGMRWISERAEPLLHLRCVDLNGDWPLFIQWVEEQYCRELEGEQLVQIQTNLPPPLRRAA